MIDTPICPVTGREEALCEGQRRDRQGHVAIPPHYNDNQNHFSPLTRQLQIPESVATQQTFLAYFLPYRMAGIWDPLQGGHELLPTPSLKELRI